MTWFRASPYALRSTRVGPTLGEIIKLGRRTWIQAVHKPKQFSTPSVHLTGGMILEKVNWTISLPASATFNAAGSEKVIEGSAKHNETLDDSVDFSSQLWIANLEFGRQLHSTFNSSGIQCFDRLRDSVTETL